MRYKPDRWRPTVVELGLLAMVVIIITGFCR